VNSLAPLPPDLAARVTAAGVIPAAPSGTHHRVRLRLETTLRWGAPPATVALGRRWFGGGAAVSATGLPIPGAGVSWMLGVGALVLGAATAAILMRHPVKHSPTDLAPPAPPAETRLLPVPAQQ